MITSRERLQVVLRRRLPVWAHVTSICYWQETLERMRRESLSAGTDPPEYLLRVDAVQRAVESEAGVPLEVLEENEPWRAYREPGATPLTAADEEAQQDEEEPPAVRAARAQERYTAHRDLLLSPLLRSVVGTARRDPGWEDVAEY